MKIDNTGNQNASTSRGLRDPIWQFVAAIIAVVSVFVRVYFPLISQQRREISAKINSISILGNDSKIFDEKIKILFESKEVKNVSVSEIKVKNTGNSSIIDKDFIEPISVESKTCYILSKKTVFSKPDWLKDSVKLVNINQSKFRIDPLLFNSGEEFTVRVLTSDCVPQFYFTSRILGVSQLNMVRDGTTLSWVGWLSIPLLLAIFPVMVYGSSEEAEKIAKRLSRLKELKYDTEKRYLFEPERTSRLDKINEEIKSVKDQYKKSDKTKSRGSLIGLGFIAIALVIIYLIANQPTF